MTSLVARCPRTGQDITILSIFDDRPGAPGSALLSTGLDNSAISKRCLHCSEVHHFAAGELLVRQAGMPGSIFPASPASPA